MLLSLRKVECFNTKTVLRKIYKICPFGVKIDYIVRGALAEGTLRMLTGDAK